MQEKQAEIEPLYRSYEAVVRRSLEVTPQEWTFKSHPAYQQVLEHVSPTQGMEYHLAIASEFPEFLDQHRALLEETIQSNDSLGNPRATGFKGIGVCSPTNLRYAYHALLIIKHALRADKEADIIEIGGGYGGLALFIHKFSEVFGLKIKSYTMFDLPSVSILQRKYLEHHGISVRTQGPSFPELQQGSFLISNYALSELAPPIHDKYMETVIGPFVTAGFLIWNYYYDDPSFPGLTIRQEAERPQTNSRRPSTFVYLSS